MYYGGASYEKSQMFPLLRQLAQRHHMPAAGDPDGGPAVHAASMGTVFSDTGADPCMRCAAVSERMKKGPPFYDGPSVHGILFT